MFAFAPRTERTAGALVVRVEEEIRDIDSASVSRSIFVTGFQTTTKSEDLIIHFQRKKNGGGDIESITVSKQGTAVITFDNPEVVMSASKHKQEFEGVILTVEPYLDRMLKSDKHFEVFELVSAELCLEFVEYLSREQTEALLKEIAAETGVKWIESSENFIVSGTFKQVEESRAYLQQGAHQSNGIVVLGETKREAHRSQSREDSKSQLDGDDDNEEDVDQNRQAEVAPKEGTRDRPPEGANKMGIDDTSSSASPEIQSFEIEPKIVKAFIKAHEKDLNDIEAKYQVEIPRTAEGSKFSLKPKNECSAEEYDKACNCFIALYQKMYQLIKMERFSLKSEKLVVRSREAISRASKKFPISIERSKDVKFWELYGMANHIEEALKYLEEEGVEIKRETENAIGGKEWKKDLFSSSKGEKHPGELNKNRPENYLGAQRKPSTAKLNAAQPLQKGVGLSKEERVERVERLEIELGEVRRLLKTREGELRDKERSFDQLQRTLQQDRQSRSRVDEELRQARIAYTQLEERLQSEQSLGRTLQQDLQTKENVIREQQGRLKEEQQQKTAVEEKLRRLARRMEEETRRHSSTERELQSALSAAEEALTEYQRHKSRDWIIQREQIDLSAKILGEGAWGEVHEGTFRGCQVAVKQVHKLILSDYNRRLFEREMSIASRCRHPHLLQFIGATNDDGSPLFVTELLDTSLRHVLHQRALNRVEILNLALDIAKGLNYLHLCKPNPIMHRDISSANVLLWRRDDSWKAKLSDYGAANFMRQSMTANPGAIIYSAPEAFTPQQSPKVDVYSFGVLLCEMCIREQPDPKELRNQIGRVTGDIRGLIQRCVERDPEPRPTMSEIIRELEQIANPLVKN